MAHNIKQNLASKLAKKSGPFCSLHAMINTIIYEAVSLP